MVGGRSHRGGPAGTEGTPEGTGSVPRSQTRRGQGGSGAGSRARRVFPAPVPVQEAPEQPRLRPSAQCWEQGGGTGTRGHGDLSQSSVFNCFSTPPWARLNARGPRCPCVTHPRALSRSQGNGGCSSPLLGVPFQPGSGGHGQPPAKGGSQGTAGPLFSTSRPPLGIEEYLSAGPKIKQYMGNSSGSGSRESPGHGPVPQHKEVSLGPGHKRPWPERCPSFPGSRPRLRCAQLPRARQEGLGVGRRAGIRTLRLGPSGRYRGRAGGEGDARHAPGHQWHLPGTGPASEGIKRPQDTPEADPAAGQGSPQPAWLGLCFALLCQSCSWPSQGGGTG